MQVVEQALFVAYQTCVDQLGAGNQLSRALQGVFARIPGVGSSARMLMVQNIASGKKRVPLPIQTEQTAAEFEAQETKVLQTVVTNLRTGEQTVLGQTENDQPESATVADNATVEDENFEAELPVMIWNSLLTDLNANTNVAVGKKWRQETLYGIKEKIKEALTEQGNHKGIGIVNAHVTEDKSATQLAKIYRTAFEG